MITTDNDATATTYLGDLSVGVDATDLANDWFVAVDWQAGAQFHRAHRPRLSRSGAGQSDQPTAHPAPQPVENPQRWRWALVFRRLGQDFTSNILTTVY
jgi:hypothetical protein